MTLHEAIQDDIRRISKVVADLEIALSEPGRNQAPALSQHLAFLLLPDKNEGYHKAILKLAIDSKLVPQNQVALLRDLLAFRHFSRHNYGAELRPDEVREKAEAATKAWVSLKLLLAEGI